MRGIAQRIGAALCAVFAAASCAGAPPEDGPPRFPISSDYPPGTMERVSFTAPIAEGWRISALTTLARPDADWKVVIITGTPSWSEYWAPTIAAAPPGREVIAADRPGFQDSEPQTAVTDIAAQADALSPMLEARPGQRVIVVGQSFGAPIATLMAERYPERVHALMLMSPYFGDRGPTARRLVGVGSLVRGLLPRDMKNAIAEIRGQPAQLPTVFEALARLEQPIVFLHGDDDSFVPLSSAERVAGEHGRPLVVVPGGDHFLNACCVPALWAAVEQAIAEAEAADATTGSKLTP